MPFTLTVHDQTASGNTTHSIPLEFPSDRLTVRELIRERIYQEVNDYNRKSDPVFRGLIQPSDAEARLNGFHRRAHKPIDWNIQFGKAIDAFSRNGFFILIDDRQAETLDQEFVIGRDTRVSFVRLMPLVGG